MHLNMGCDHVIIATAATSRLSRRAAGDVDLPDASRIDVVPIHASPEAAKALGDAARSALEDDLEAKLDELTDHVEGLLQAKS